MADEARLVIELVEGNGGVSGSPGRPSSGPSIPSQGPAGSQGAPDVPAAQGPKPSQAKVPKGSKAKGGGIAPLKPSEIVPAEAVTPPGNSLATILKKLLGSSTVQTTNQIISKGAPAVAGALSKAGLGSAAGAVGSSAAAAAGILGAGTGVGLVVAGATAAIGLPIAAAAGTAAIASSAANSLARVSPDIAAARANAQVAQTMQQLRSAQVIGPELAEFTTAVSDMKIEITRARDLFLDQAAEPLADTIKIVAHAMGKINDVLESPLAKQLFDSSSLAKIIQILDWVADIIPERQKNSVFMLIDKIPLPEPTDAQWAAMGLGGMRSGEPVAGAIFGLEAL